MEKIIFIVASFAIMYITVGISYSISGIGIEETVNEALKSFMIYIFVPINVIILIPFVARKYYKWKQNEIDKESLIKTIIIVLIIGVIILTVQTIYFKQIKKNIQEMKPTAILDGEAKNETPSEPMENTLANEEKQKIEEYNNSLLIINNAIDEEMKKQTN